MDISIKQGNGIGGAAIQPLGRPDANQPPDRPDAQTPPQLTITEQTAGLPSAEPSIAEIPDAALTRDDPLGELMKTAFNLPPPPMPNFE